MSFSNATTLPRSEPIAGAGRGWRRSRLADVPPGTAEAARPRERGERLAALSLAFIVVCCLLIVLAAAERPSILSATSHPGFFPRWLAGPLGGLWPWLTHNRDVLRYGVSGAVLAMFGFYLLAVRHAPRLRARWAIATIVAVHLTFVLAPPMMLTDIFNYINYGRMEIVHGLNPYTSVPVLEPHMDPSFSVSNWHQLSSPYGPLFTILTFAFVPAGVAASFWGLKILLMCASLSCVLLVWKCARLLGREPIRAIVFLGLNPVVLMWGLGGDHNDFVMLVFIMLGFYLLLRSSHGRGRLDDNAVVGDADAGPPQLLGLTRLGEPPPRTLESNGSGKGRTGATTDVNGAATDGREASNGGAAPAEALQVVGAGLIARSSRAFQGLAGGLRPLRIARPPAAEAEGDGLSSWILPLLPLEIGAGAAFVTAVALKASGAIILPVVLAGLLRHPRRLIQVLIGMIAAGILLAAASLLAFGPHLPSLGTQGNLVDGLSVPNLIGLALGQGGITGWLHTLIDLALVIAVLACAYLAWRRRDSLTAAGWASAALIFSLSWALPWYVLWVLPLAAISRSTALRRTAIGITLYMILVWMPINTSILDGLGLHPQETRLGQQHAREVKQLER